MALNKQLRASAKGLKTIDVIEDWRHWLRYVAACSGGRAAYTIYSIWGMTTAVYFQVIKHYIGHENSVLASVYRVSHKMISCDVEKFDMQTADIRRNYCLSTNLGELT